MFTIMKMSVRAGSPLPSRDDVKRLRALYVRRRAMPGKKHIPPIPGEHLYLDTRLENSGYWTIGDTPCHFSHNKCGRFGPFVQYMGRKAAKRSEYIELDAPNPRPPPRPTLVDPAMRSVSPEFFYEGPRRAGYPSDED